MHVCFHGHIERGKGKVEQEKGEKFSNDFCESVD